MINGIGPYERAERVILQLKNRISNKIPPQYTMAMRKIIGFPMHTLLSPCIFQPGQGPPKKQKNYYDNEVSINVISLPKKKPLFQLLQILELIGKRLTIESLTEYFMSSSSERLRASKSPTTTLGSSPFFGSSHSNMLGPCFRNKLPLLLFMIYNKFVMRTPKVKILHLHAICLPSPSLQKTN